jgi:hypothetical protein
MATKEQASKGIQEKQSEQKARYDRSRKPMPDYCVGQYVLIQKVIPTNDGKSKKLLQKYSAPTRLRKFWILIDF